MNVYNFMKVMHELGATCIAYRNDKQELIPIISIDEVREKMKDYDVGIDFTVKEIEAIERVQCWEARDDADMRRAIHQMITDLAEIKNIDISDIGLEVD